MEALPFAENASEIRSANDSDNRFAACERLHAFAPPADLIMRPNNPFGEFHDGPAFAPLAERKNEA